MGLLSLLRKLKIQEKEIRVVILGLESAGKTTIARCFANENNDQPPASTDGFEIHKIDYRDYHLSFWDIGGSASNRPFWRNYFDQCDTLIWVIDSADQTKFEETKKELETCIMSDRLQGVSLILIASKQDVQGAVPFPDVIRNLEINIDQRNWTAISFAPNHIEEINKCIAWIVGDFISRTAPQ